MLFVLSFLPPPSFFFLDLPRRPQTDTLGITADPDPAFKSPKNPRKKNLPTPNPSCPLPWGIATRVLGREGKTRDIKTAKKGSSVFSSAAAAVVVGYAARIGIPGHDGILSLRLSDAGDFNSSPTNNYFFRKGLSLNPRSR